MTIVRRILPVLLAAVLLSACGETKDVLPEIEQEVKQEVETVLEEVEPTPEPTQTPEEAKTMASTASNATKDAPQVTDPSTWNDAGKTIMEALEKQYAPYGMTLQAKEGTPYFLAVNRDANVVTVYTADEDGRYTVPFMAMVCSGGVDTTLGYYATPVDYDWRLLMGPSYGQYATRIFDSYLFHSVPTVRPSQLWKLSHGNTCMDSTVASTAKPNAACMRCRVSLSCQLSRRSRQ